MNKMDKNDTAMLVSIGIVGAGALTYGATNAGVTLPLTVGGLLLAIDLVVAQVSRGGLISQWALPALGIAMVGLLIHCARGVAEAHFAVFAFLACTVVYRRWQAVMAGAGTIAVHHLFLTTFSNGAGAPCASPSPAWAR